jgi:hypothetical protein
VALLPCEADPAGSRGSSCPGSGNSHDCEARPYRRVLTTLKLQFFSVLSSPSVAPTVTVCLP